MRVLRFAPARNRGRKATYARTPQEYATRLNADLARGEIDPITIETTATKGNGTMTKHDCIEALIRTGIAYSDAVELRRIAMQLHRWHELECGVDSGGVERDEATGKCYWYNSYTGTRQPTADRETGALRRLKETMARYPTLGYYVQGDPRGAALYILRPGDVPEGKDADAYYSRGVAVYK